MANQDPECVFCGIVAGEVTGSFVYEDDHVVAFLDINPLTSRDDLDAAAAAIRDAYEGQFGPA